MLSILSDYLTVRIRSVRNLFGTSGHPIIISTAFHGLPTEPETYPSEWPEYRITLDRALEKETMLDLIAAYFQDPATTHDLPDYKSSDWQALPVALESLSLKSRADDDDSLLIALEDSGGQD